MAGTEYLEYLEHTECLEDIEGIEGFEGIKRVEDIDGMEGVITGRILEGRVTADGAEDIFAFERSENILAVPDTYVW